MLESIIMERILKLEEDIKLLRTKFLCEDYIITAMNPLNERMCKLEEAYKYMTDIKCGKLQVYVDEDKSTINYKIDHVNKRISELEKELHSVLSNTKYMNNVKFHELEKQIKNINGVTDAVKRAISFLQDSDGRKPYKCPICDGLGENRNESLLYMYAKLPSCKTCEGKGIIWG